MALNILRRNPRRGSGGGALATQAATEVDRLRDRLSFGSLRNNAERVLRWIGLTRSGYIALVGAVMLWLVGRIVSGTAMYLAAYGAVAFVVIGILLAPRRLGLTA